MARTREEELRAAAMRELMRRMKRDGTCTQKEFAKKCGIPETSLSELLRGKRPGSKKKWLDMSTAAGWEYDALLELGDKILSEDTAPQLYIVTQQNNRGVITGVSNAPAPVAQEEITGDLCERIARKLEGKDLEARIALWAKIKNALEEDGQ